jgi:uncharacterized membrane protein
MGKINLLHKLVLFCVTLILMRIIKTGHYSFVFLFWNLFLAWLPLFFVRLIKNPEKKMQNLVLLMLSVLFLPNAPYILTDLFHLKKQLLAPLWFDTVLILSFAFTGLIYFIMALEKILEEAAKLLPSFVNTLAKPALFLATGYGIYLGRFLRYNSWDLLFHPFRLTLGMLRSVFSWEHCRQTIPITIIFTIFLYLLYEIYVSFKNRNGNIHKEKAI